MNSTAKHSCRGCKVDNPEGSRFCVVCGDVMALGMRPGSDARGGSRHGELGFFQRPELLSAAGVALVVLTLGSVWIATARHSPAYAGNSSSGSSSYEGSTSTSGSAGTTDSTESSERDEAPSDESSATPQSAAVTPSLVEASASLPEASNSCTDETISYQAGNLFDGDENTGWGVHGDPSGTTVTITLPAETVITQVGLVPGYAKVGPRGDAHCADASAWPHNRHVTSVTWSFQDGTSVSQDFTDSQRMQTIPVDGLSTSTVTLTINDSVQPPGAVDDTVISEVQLTGY